VDRVLLNPWVSRAGNAAFLIGVALFVSKYVSGWNPLLLLALPLLAVGVLLMAAPYVGRWRERRHEVHATTAQPSYTQIPAAAPDVKAKLDQLKVDRTVRQRARDREVGELIRRSYSIRNRINNTLTSMQQGDYLVIGTDLQTLVSDIRGFVWQRAPAFAPSLPDSAAEDEILEKGRRTEHSDLVDAYISLLQQIASHQPAPTLERGENKLKPSPQPRRSLLAESLTLGIAEDARLGVLPIATELRDIRHRIEMIRAMSPPAYARGFRFPDEMWRQSHKVLSTKPELYAAVERAYAAARHVGQSLEVRETRSRTSWTFGVIPDDGLDQAYEAAGEALDALGQPRGEPWQSVDQKAAGPDH
jgi:hypothetical protein